MLKIERKKASKTERLRLTKGGKAKRKELKKAFYKKEELWK